MLCHQQMNSWMIGKCFIFYYSIATCSHSYSSIAFFVYSILEAAEKFRNLSGGNDNTEPPTFVSNNGTTTTNATYASSTVFLLILLMHTCTQTNGSDYLLIYRNNKRRLMWIKIIHQPKLIQPLQAPIVLVCSNAWLATDMSPYCFKMLVFAAFRSTSFPNRQIATVVMRPTAPLLQATILLLWRSSMCLSSSDHHVWTKTKLWLYFLTPFSLSLSSSQRLNFLHAATATGALGSNPVASGGGGGGESRCRARRINIPNSQINGNCSLHFSPLSLAQYYVCLCAYEREQIRVVCLWWW